MERLESDTEHISAVQDNPFVKNYGIDTVIHSRQGTKDNDTAERKCTDRLETKSGEAENKMDKNDEAEPEQEYHVNSGFVNKLRSKFAELESRNKKVISLSRKSASVENLLSLSSSSQAGYREKSRSGKASRSSADDTKVELRKKQSNLVSSNRSSFERPKSNEIRTKPDKPPLIKPPLAPKGKLTDFSRPNNVIRSVKPPVARRGSTEALRKQRSSDSSPTKIEHHDWKVAPDLQKIDTDNIVIIETTIPTSPREATLQRIQSEESTEVKHVRPLKDKSVDNSKKENELPKPNTVSSFLSLFEKGQKPVRPIQAWRKNLSPTRKSSGSDASSPRNASPGVTPRSPLTKAPDDNVFIDAQGKSDSSIDNILFNDTKDVLEPLVQSSLAVSTEDNSNSSSVFQNDTKTDVDTRLSHSKHLERTQSLDEELKPEVEDSTAQDKDISPRIESNIMPVTPLHMIFDSSSVAPKKKTVKLKNDKGHHVHKVPKDTLALKHDKEHYKVKSTSIESRGISLSPKDMKKTDFVERNAASIENNEDILMESNVKPSQRKAKVSPRKTKIFDSSNMLKANRDPPRIPSRNLSGVPKEIRAKEKAKQNSDFEDKENKKSIDSKLPRVTQNLKKETKNAFDKIANERSGSKVQSMINTPKGYEFPKDEVNDSSNSMSGPDELTPKLTSETQDQPVTGLSTFVANRLKKSQEQNGQQLKTSSMHLLNGSSPSPVPRKRQAPEIPKSSISNDVDMGDDKNKAGPPPLPATPEPELPKTNIDDIMSRRKKSAKPMPKMVFDSSKIANKRKEAPKRKPPRKTLEEINKVHTNGIHDIPKLDLSSITNDTNESEYQEGYIPTVIQPCPFKFVGGDIILEKSPYKKTKKVKTQLKISFDDHATTTFEYDREEAALEAYLDEHPEEREAALRQEEEVNSVVDEVNDDPTKDSTRHSESETLKSNTVIGQPTGAFTNYKSKMQIDFQFGVPTESSHDDILFEPESEHEVDPDSLQILPAQENELDAFSAEVSKADMLF